MFREMPTSLAASPTVIPSISGTSLRRSGDGVVGPADLLLGAFLTLRLSPQGGPDLRRGLQLRLRMPLNESRGSAGIQSSSTFGPTVNSSRSASPRLTIIASTFFHVRGREASGGSIPYRTILLADQFCPASNRPISSLPNLLGKGEEPRRNWTQWPRRPPSFQCRRRVCHET
jgi:hypothetical protein